MDVPERDADAPDVGGAMVLIMLFALYWGGPAIFGSSAAISIEWGIEPNLVGSDVEIDGKVVGKLEKFGLG